MKREGKGETEKEGDMPEEELVLVSRCRLISDEACEIQNSSTLNDYVTATTQEALNENCLPESSQLQIHDHNK